MFGCVKLIGYLASAVNIVSSNHYVGPSTRIKVSFPLLPICTDVLISTSKIMTFLSMLPSDNEIV